MLCSVRVAESCCQFKGLTGLLGLGMLWQIRLGLRGWSADSRPGQGGGGGAVDPKKAGGGGGGGLAGVLSRLFDSGVEWDMKGGQGGGGGGGCGTGAVVSTSGVFVTVVAAVWVEASNDVMVAVVGLVSR